MKIKPSIFDESLKNTFNSHCIYKIDECKICPKKIKAICNKCRKDMPKDEEKSNNYWLVNKPECPCGGKTKFIIE